MEKGNALIRILHQVDPDSLEDEEWARRLGESTYFMKQMAELLFGRISTSTKTQ